MVSYPDLSSLNDTSGIGGLMSLPSSAYPYFYAWIMGGLWMIISLSLYFSERQRKGKSNILSSMAVACFSIMILSVTGTIVGFISLEIMIYILVFSFSIIGIWFFTSGR